MDGHLPCSHVHVHIPCSPCCSALPGPAARAPAYCGTQLQYAWYIQCRTAPLARTREPGMGKLLQQAVQQLPSPSQIAASALSLVVPRHVDICTSVCRLCAKDSGWRTGSRQRQSVSSIAKGVRSNPTNYASTRWAVIKVLLWYDSSNTVPAACRMTRHSTHRVPRLSKCTVQVKAKKGREGSLASWRGKARRE